ncbi:MAG TPA: ABC transporter substrate-binding protein, partial [Thermodesulfobacteriota bacterium]|nr:ABC transporter substrate-binding protein [Thermodesulfobacteriota bacterium]
MKRKWFMAVIVLASAVSLAAPGWTADVIKVGFDIELTGDIPKVGEASKFTGEMLKEQINKQGGLKVGNKSYQVNFIYEDNEAKAESASAAALKLITRDQVLGIIGPQASKQAIPAG